MTAAQKRTERAIAGALASVDELWNAEALAGIATPAVLRELIVNALAGELDLAIYPERFESLLDAVRMTA